MEKHLCKYWTKPIIDRIFENFVRNQDDNVHMLKLCRDIFDEPLDDEIACLVESTQSIY